MDDLFIPQRGLFAVARLFLHARGDPSVDKHR
jgi:hypothetical protein